MLARFIAFFVDRPLLTNMTLIAVLLGGVLAWQEIKKEERPDITADFVRVSASYPGATAQEVEYFVTRELEAAFKGVEGVAQITSSVSRGSTTVSIELERGLPNKDEVITEIRNVALGVDLPPEVRDKPTVRVFKSAKKAIIDIALIHSEAHLLDNAQREEVQRLATALELQLTNLPEIHSVTRSGYLQQELQIQLDPARLVRYQIPLSQVSQEISRNHIRQPAGSIDIKDEPNVTVHSPLDSVESLRELYIQAGFQGEAITLGDIAEVRSDYRRSKEIIKVNGHQAIMFNVVKNGSYGILESLAAVDQVVASFSENNLRHSPVELVLLDDESYEVRNRLSIIGTNGAIGFLLILFTLFIFLNRRAAVWVAVGIPFTVCLTLVATLMMGYTINNITLAAVIIVMGIVVDDAIVVAENIDRFRSMGLVPREAVIRGTSQVFMPVVASIVTTCVAFIPLFYFSGYFGSFVSFIPPIVFLMLMASLLEALVILPGHLHTKQTVKEPVKQHWFHVVEDGYGRLLLRLLNWKYFILLGFALLMLAAWKLAESEMKFVMFPHTETREIVLMGIADKHADRYQTAAISKQIEDLITPYIGKEVVGFRTEIARSRRGGAAVENRFRMIVEIVPREERERSADDLVALWQPEAEKIAGLAKLVINKSRWGQSSGSAVEVVILENDDQLRRQAAEKILAAMQQHEALHNAEIDEPLTLPEYKVAIDRNKAKRLGINPADISATIRASLEGDLLYELPSGTEKIDVRLSVMSEAKQNMDAILTIPVENRSRYLAPIGDLVSVSQTQTPTSIDRYDAQRITRVYADLKPGAQQTPLQLADALESTVFKTVMSTQPTTTLRFDGEVADSRDSKNDFRDAVVMVTFLIFIILAVLFNSVARPLLIMLAIPFGMVGVVFAFWLHGQTLFGFFAAVGALGMAGVVINDAIIMLTKLDQSLLSQPGDSLHEKIAAIAQTRLKAVVLTTLTTVAGVLPTAYGVAGYDAMLSEMMLALAWGLVFGTLITLLLVPCLYAVLLRFARFAPREQQA